MYAISMLACSYCSASYRQNH